MSRRQFSPTTLYSSPDFQQLLHRIFWLMFCTTSKEDLQFDGVEQRWRLLLWALLVSTLWSTADHNWGIFAPIMLLLCLIKVSVMCARRSTAQHSTGCWQFPACLALLCSATVLSTTSSYQTFAHLMQKLAVKEYHLWCHWCPDTHVTIAGVIVITCTVQGIPKWSTLSNLVDMSCLKGLWTPLTKHRAGSKSKRLNFVYKENTNMFSVYDI